MITTKQIQEIRDFLNKTENPLIFFDNDADGICSYILLKKYIGKAKGIPIKSSPDLSIEYYRKIEEYQPDLVIILDKPLVNQELIDQIQVPIIWIDHHPPVKRRKVNYFNPLLEDPKDNRPVTYWCYKITEQNICIAMIGTVSDWHIPDFTNEFIKQYPNLLDKKVEPEEAIFNSKLGELIRIYSFAIKGDTTETKKAIEVLSKIETPEEILNQTTARGKFIYKRAEKFNKEYQELLKKAIKQYDKNDKLLIFTYTTKNTSFTNEVANELLYKYPEKLIIVGREKSNEIKMSLRSGKIEIPKILEKALVNVKGYGGGHEHACGSSVAKNDFEIFIQNIRGELNGN